MEPQEPTPSQSSRLGDAPPRVASEAARTAGRGFLLITAAKLWFMVMGAVINVGLPIVMTPDDFGVYSIVINAVSLINMVIVTGTTQAVAKLVSERPRDASRLLTRALLLQLAVGVPIALAYTGAAPWIADSFNDPSLTDAIRLSGGVLFAYAFYAIAVGYFNGLKAFGAQAALDMTFSTLKSLGIVAAVLLGWGVMGAVGAFAASAALITAIAWALALRAARSAPPAAPDDDALKDSTRKLLGYLLLVMLFTFGVNGVLRVDLFTLKALVESAPPEAHLSADRISGVYAAMQNVSRLPYQAVIAVTAVVFPMISQATFENDKTATRAYIQSTLRYSLLMLSGLGALLAGNAREIVLTLYGPDYLVGAWPLAALSLATVGFALFFTATSMVTGAGHPLASVLLSALTLAATVAFNAAALLTLIPRGAPEAELLLAASLATAAAMLLGFAATVAYLVRRHHAGLPWSTALRTALASLAVIAPSLLLTFPALQGRWPNLAALALKGTLGGLLFLGLLWALREITTADLQRVQAVLQRRRRA